MFNNGYSIREAYDIMNRVEDELSFKEALYVIKNCLKDMQVHSDVLFELEKRAFYISNEYSEKDNKEKVLAAKHRVLAYVDELMNTSLGDNLLVQILENFYSFLESLWEREPHGKGGIRKEHLHNIKVKNEYDVQHLLYAYLKPLFPTVRAEVSEDTGYNTVRVDISVSADCVIEVKCTRQGMQEKKLIEEIEADMVHYSASNIYFFIYDKEKLISNPQAFKQSYQNKVKGKTIHIILLQPVIL